MTDGRIPLRLKWLAALCAVMFAALGTRLWFMQVLAAQEFQAKARQNGIRLVYTEPPRGWILDRNGRVLVRNRPSLTVMVSRDQLGTHEEEVLFRLSKLLRMPIKDIVARLNDPRYDPYTPIPIKAYVPKRVAFEIGEHQDLYPGVSAHVLPVRTYPHGGLAAQVLGYTGEIGPQQLASAQFKARGYQQGDIVGQSGIEGSYEPWLQGRKGEEKFKVNSTGRNLGPIGSARQYVPGDNVQLSLDARIQYLAEHSLVLGEQAARHVYDSGSGRDLSADGGAVVVMNPRNGQVLALASSPSYDPRVFTNGLSTKEYKSLNDPARHNPLFDRATQAGYPPGSTYKPFIALSALRRGFASPYGSYACPPVYHVPGDPNTVFNNWTTANYGYISLSQALVISCDTVFYNFGWDYWVSYAHSGPGTSSAALTEYKGRTIWLQHDLRSFSFGSATGLDIPYEFSGRVPNPRWKAHIHRTDPKAFPYGLWLPGDYINMSIGQGDTLVTPLQQAVAFSAIANGGTVWQPRLALAVRNARGHLVRRIPSRRVGRLPFSQADLSFVRAALTQVPVSGTAAVAFQGFPFSQVPVAGKTGTAQVPPHQPYSWFAAMAPANDPKYVVVCLVEQGGHGSTTAAPVVRRILEGLFGLPQTPITPGSIQD